MQEDCKRVDFVCSITRCFVATLRDRRLVGLSKGLDHLVFRETSLAHRSLTLGGSILSSFRWSTKARADHLDRLVLSRFTIFILNQTVVSAAVEWEAEGVHSTVVAADVDLRWPSTTRAQACTT